MLFNSITFILFHCLFAAIYWTTSVQKLRLWCLLFGSIMFYGWYYWPALILIGLLMLVNYGFSHWIERATRQARVLAFAIVVNISSLVWFKYSGFIAENMVLFLRANGVEVHLPQMSNWLPLGISFYTFQVISYLVDISRGMIKAERNFLLFGVFKIFYAQLIAGPIVRASDLIPQLKHKRRFDPQDLHLGIYYVLAGLTIKICIADTLAQFVDYGFQQPEQLSRLSAWLTLYGFAIQILSDFWGYSTIAIGLGLMYGIRLPVNFNQPYIASSLRDFWRRWHITLSSWLRDYIYIPLGGSRKRHKINLFLTMLIGGVWHGASWNFIFWGAGHGLWLVLERYMPQLFPNHVLFKWLKIILVFNGVCLLWVFFRASEFPIAVAYFNALFFSGAQPLSGPPELLVGLLLGFIIFSKVLGASLLDRRFIAWSLRRQLVVSLILMLLILAYTDARLDFIYFVF